MAATKRIPLFPRPGVYRGATAEVSAQRWWDMNLMRWRAGQLQPIGGWAALPGVSLGSGARDILTWHDNAGHRWGAFGTDDKLYAYDFDLATLHDITPAGVGPLEPPGLPLGYGLGDYGTDAYGTARDPADVGIVDISAILGDMWALDLFGQDLMILPTQDGRLHRWSPTTPTTLPVVVAGAPTANRAMVVTDERHVVVCGASGNVREVAWSEQEDPNTWTPDITNLAGSLQLETEGRPIYAIRVPSGVLIFTDNDVHLMKYVGPPFGYGITKIGSNCGPISRRAISQAGGLTMWMSPQGFWQYDGSLGPLVCDVGDWLFSLLNRASVGRVFGAPNPSFGEHWWFWPDEGSQECNRYVGINYLDPTKPWIIGQLERTAADVKGAMLRPIMTDQAGHILLHEYGWTDNGATRLGTVYAETGNYALGEGDERMSVLQIIQDFVGPADAVAYRFFFTEEPMGTEYDTGTFPIVNSTGRTDMGAGFACREMRMRVEALSDEPWALGKTRLRVRASGFV